jgi:hypothetical protein
VTRTSGSDRVNGVITQALRMASVVQPSCDLIGIESNEASPFDVRDALVGNEPADVADGDPEVIGELFDGEEMRK